MGQPVSQRLAMIGQQAGEPSRNLKYNPTMCQQIRDLAQAGKFPEQWAAALGVSLESFRRWGHEYPDFKDAMIVARYLLNAYWTEKAHNLIEKPGVNQAVLTMMLKGRFPEFYGNDPVNPWHFLHSEDGSWRPPVADPASAAAAGWNMQLGTEDEVQAKLAALKARREAESKA